MYRRYVNLTIATGSGSTKEPAAIVSQINQSGFWQAELLSKDGPAVFLSKQTNAGVPMPYECVVSGIGLIGLTEPALPSVAATPSGGLAYQVRECLPSFTRAGEAMVIAAAMTCLGCRAGTAVA